MGKSDFLASPRKRSFLLSLLLILVTLAVYNSVSNNGFINLDDNLYVTQNEHVQAGLHWETVKWAFTTEDLANWHPLTWLAYSVDWRLFGRSAGGYHYINLLLHACNAVLLFLLLESATGFAWRSLIVAALFALHPVNVESVAWIAELKNVLSMTFFLLALLAYGWYAHSPSSKRYAPVALCFALGLMVKPQVITLPFVLLLWDYWPLERFGAVADKDSPSRYSTAPFWRLLLEKTPLFLFSAADALITLHTQRTGNAVRTFSDYSRYGRLSNSVIAYVRYVGHAFWPLHLSPTYSHPGDSIPVWQVTAAGTFLLLTTVLVVLSRRRYLLTGWLWFLGVLVPMIGLVQVGDQAMADRYAYVPFVGLFWIAVWSIGEMRERCNLSTGWVAVPACLCLFGVSVLSHRLVSYWHDSETLWDYALTVDPGDFMAHCNRGRILVAENRPQEAIPELFIAQRLHNYPLSEVLRFAEYETRYGHAEDAAARCRTVLQATNDPKLRLVAWTNMGIAEMKLNQLAAAKDDFDHARQTDARDPGALVGLGLVAERSGDFSQAAHLFSSAIRLQPENDLAYFLLGTALEKAGQLPAAQAAYAQGQRVSPDPNALLLRARELLR